MVIVMISMLHEEEIRRSQSLRERSRELRERAARACAKSQSIVGRSVNNQKAGESSHNGADKQNSPSPTDRTNPFFKS
jgi:hypothetical protein